MSVEKVRAELLHRVDNSQRACGQQVGPVARPPGDGDGRHASCLCRQYVNHGVTDVDTIRGLDAEPRDGEKQRLRVRLVDGGVLHGNEQRQLAVQPCGSQGVRRRDVTLRRHNADGGPGGVQFLQQLVGAGVLLEQAGEVFGVPDNVAVDQFLGPFGVAPRESFVERSPNPASSLLP